MSPIDVTVQGAAAAAVQAEVPPLVEARFASRLFAQDHTLWGQDAEEEAAKRLLEAATLLSEQLHAYHAVGGLLALAGVWWGQRQPTAKVNQLAPGNKTAT